MSICRNLGQKKPEVHTESFTLFLQFRAPLGQASRLPQPFRHSPESRIDSRRFPVGKKPVPGKHPGQYFKKARRQMGLVAKQRPVRVVYERLKRNGRIGIPVPGQEMIVEQVHHDRPEMAVNRVDSPLAPQEAIVPRGKGIDLPVDFDTTPDAWRETVVEPSLDEIPHEIADQDLRIGSGKVKVHQVIHDRKILARPASKTQWKTFQAYPFAFHN